MDQPGFFNMEDRAYRALPRLNYSSIASLLKSPAHYIAKISESPASTKQMNFGSAFHSYTLEPEKFKSEYMIKTLDARTVAGKKALFEAEALKQKIISDEDFHRIKRMDAKIKAHSIASKLLTGGEAESVLLFDLNASNGNLVKCKSKVDYMFSETLIDLKTTTDASVNGFTKSIENFNYFVQGSFYSHGMEKLTGKRPDFIFVAIESEPPYSVNVIKLSENHYTVGYRNVYEAVDVYEECTRTNTYPSYPEIVYESVMSKWLK